MTYPFKDEKDIAALERLPSTAYAEKDHPYLFTQRNSISPDFEASDVIAKQRVDLQGALENQWWLNHNKEKMENL